ncbi:NAD(P)-dependent alcohol dehydrogenase [Rhodococcus spongiicola]|uniref:NAD(P)-dependent alcohol dehydrogenase n=2 Tax=Rhodococcus spongiicola TaxID=2487352 RepID=A0A438B717_9NOCA|nr:NAD(P)-dependent alcohol dehydrogenase [Rhodococcus spongiicola]
MRAAIRREYGGPEAVEIAAVRRPSIRPDQVLVRVVAAGVDRGVWHLATGLPYLVRLAGFGVRRPKQPVLGSDVAGIIEAVGADVSDFAVGDEVFGVADGSYAEYAVADPGKLARKPARIPFDQAAAAPVSGITALLALVDVGRIRAGQRVLVLGASGGVGSFAVQISRSLGAHVTGVASAAKLDLVRSLGADSVIDYRELEVTSLPGRFDLIVDIGGNTPVHRLRRILEPTGTLVICGGENGGRFTGGVGRQFRAVSLSPFVRQRLTTFISAERREHLERLAEFLVAGSVVSMVGHRYALDEMPRALADLVGGAVAGKAIVIVDPSRS